MDGLQSDQGNFVEMMGRENRGSFDCDKCGKTLSSNETLRRHIKEVHNRSMSRVFACKFCEKGFYRKDCMQRHIQERHENSSLVCDYCGDNFRKRGHVAKHVNHETREIQRKISLFWKLH